MGLFSLQPFTPVRTGRAPDARAKGCCPPQPEIMGRDMWNFSAPVFTAFLGCLLYRMLYFCR